LQEVIKLPNGRRAVVDIAKLKDYCLNPFHEDGKHKARVFAAALGLGRTDAEWLRERIVEAAVSELAFVSSETRFGTLYMLDFELTTASSSAVVRTGWIVRHSEDFPRLTTCFVKRSATL
jgi:hypothetical protein